MTQINFDANQVAPNTGPSVVPKGDYKAMITSSEIKPTKNGQGKYIEFNFQIIEGEATNRNLKARLNIENANQQAVDIARGDLSAICHATGVIQLQDTTQLHNIPLMISVIVRPAHGQYGESNEIKGFSEVENGGVMAPAATPAPPAAAATPAAQPPAQNAAPMQAAPAQPAQAAPAATPVEQAAPLAGAAGGTPNWAG